MVGSQRGNSLPPIIPPASTCFETRHRVTRRAAASLCIALTLSVHGMAQQPLTPEERAGIAKDTARHFGDAPDNPGPKATQLSGALRQQDVSETLKKVADWELNRAQPYFDRIWTWSVLYSGLLAASDALHDPKYRDAVISMAEKYHWELRSDVPDADNQSVAQTYLELARADHREEKIAPTRAALDRLLHGQSAHIPSNQAQIAWWWCDALFMAPPVWSKMYAETKDEKYLAYLDQHWWETSKLLYDPHRHLYYRDITFLHAKGPNGAPVFWSRGNGWVMAGIAGTLETMPSTDSHRTPYEHQLRQMASAITKLQDHTSGLWHSNLLDVADYPAPETSGSALIVYALAWGVNQGILPRRWYMPAISSGWQGLVQEIYADGRLGDVQQTGSAPAHYLPSSSYNYGVGAFLLAGSEMMKLSSNIHSGAAHQ